MIPVKKTMNLRTRIWKIATFVVVFFVILNPEMIDLAIFLNAVGLESFLMLIEIQVISVLVALYNQRLKLLVISVKQLISIASPVTALRRFIQTPGIFTYAAPTQATFMHLLVMLAISSNLISAVL
jgi:hypothetical protein